MDYLSESIKSLQTQGLKVSKQLEILETVKQNLKGKASEKLRNSLRKNPDLENFTGDGKEYEFKWKTSYAPLVTVDVERSFSQYKDILADKRHSMTHKTIQHFNIIKFNKFLYENE